MAKQDIDGLLRAAVDDGRVPGVVALALDRSGVCYQGAFGKRSLNEPAAMTLDTVFRIASMTKAVTGVAAMQCVERGTLALDQPAGEIVPELAEPQVLEGFDADGKARLRPARRKITLRMLLTHTAGFVYPVWNANFDRYCQITGFPVIMSGRLAALGAPLAFEPGERWEYGINIDWAGRMVEAASRQDLDSYMRQHIFAPLGMTDTGFVPTNEQLARSVQAHNRKPDGSLEPIERTPFTRAEFFAGGGALYSTGPDYAKFLQMLLAGGSFNGAQILKPETIALMAQNHIGDLLVEKLPTSQPGMSHDAEFFPGMKKKWGLTWLINTEDVPGRRSAGSLAWAGLFNTYFWLDPQRQVAGTILTQILPFADPTVLNLLDEFETQVYRTTTESARHA
ncbi:MAG TPA: serine hydrolase domain-containing protein [Acetobacteraceae bacterium]|nr:serine hydrolase domain-containing protein [Acetobacteraceae bacterium]